MTKPTVGRMVHYVSYGTPGGEYTSECRAAVVTAVTNEQVVDLFVMNPTGVFLNHGCVLVDDTDSTGAHAGGTWHWPERS